MSIGFKFIKVYSVGIFVWIKSYFSCFPPLWVSCPPFFFFFFHTRLLTGGSLCVSGAPGGCLVCDQKQTDSCHDHGCHALCHDFSHRPAGSLRPLPSCPSADRHRGQPLLLQEQQGHFSPCLLVKTTPSHHFFEIRPKAVFFRLHCLFVE